MANNRMYLVNKRTGHKVFIAKYYPSTGWYRDVSVSGDLDALINDVFSQVDVAGMWGDEWALEYEVDSK